MGLRKHQVFTFRNSDIDSWVEWSGWVPATQELEDDFGTTPIQDIAHDFLDHDWYKLSQGEDPYLNELRALGGAGLRHLQRWDVDHYRDEEGLLKVELEDLFVSWTNYEWAVKNVRAYRIPAEYQDYLEEVTLWIQDAWKEFRDYEDQDFQYGERYEIDLLNTKKGCRKLASYYVRGYMNAIAKWGEFHCSVNLLMELNRVAKMLQRAFEEMSVDNVDVRFMANPETYEVKFKIQDPEIARQYEYCW